MGPHNLHALSLELMLDYLYHINGQFPLHAFPFAECYRPHKTLYALCTGWLLLPPKKVHSAVYREDGKEGWSMEIEAEFELKLADGGTAKWVGRGGLDAAKRYVDSHPGEVVLAWRHPRFEIREGLLLRLSMTQGLAVACEIGHTEWHEST
jgi:hypothetical protein